MSKIILAMLTVAAFGYAAWLVWRGRPVPDAAATRGLRRRFLLATAVAMGVFGAWGTLGLGCEKRNKPQPMCYSMVAIPRPAHARVDVVRSIKHVWRTLDNGNEAAFRRLVGDLVAARQIRQREGDMLITAFTDLAFHRKRTSAGKMITCYKMTLLGGALRSSRERALAQIDLLAKARASGAIDEEIARKAHTALAREVALMYFAGKLDRRTHYALMQESIDDLEDDTVAPGDAAMISAAMIVNMEDGALPSLTVARRLSDMMGRVQACFNDGPYACDWSDPAIDPNVHKLMYRLELARPTPVTCYRRMSGPMAARSEELKALQKELLDANVYAGVLAAEVAEKALTATATDAALDLAVEKDIADYQRNVRRVVRLLYRAGEVPSDFVREVERAASVDIIAFDPAKTLPGDCQYHLRSLLKSPGTGDRVLEALEKRKLIPPRRNHRFVFHRSSSPDSKGAGDDRFQAFLGLIDGDASLKLEGDDRVTIHDHMVPDPGRAYRLKMREVVRALVATGLVEASRLDRIEACLGVSVVGKMAE